MLSSNRARLCILAFLHFTVDFYGGVVRPLAQPTLMRHLAVGFGAVVLLIGISQVVVNAIQPLSAAFLPRRGMPSLLLACPLLAAMSAMIGLTSDYGGVAALLVLSALAIGMLHPETLLAAHALAGRRQGVGLALYISGGFFGFSSGGWVGAAWATRWGLAGFWLLALPALISAALVLASGMYRLHGHGESPTPEHVSHRIPFAVVFGLTAVVATCMDLVMMFITPYLVRRFGESAQFWGGAEIFAFGLSGALASYLWGHVSENRRRCRTIALTQLAALPFLYLLIEIDRPEMAPVWGAVCGACMGGVIPLTVVLGRGAPGRASRLRAGMLVGGAFGVGSLVAVGAAQIVDMFPSDSAEPVAWALRAVMALVALEGLMAWQLERWETGRVGSETSEARK